MAERMYHVVVFRCDPRTGEQKGEQERMTATPVTHEQGCTILSKLTRYPWRREQLEEVPADNSNPRGETDR